MDQNRDETSERQRQAEDEARDFREEVETTRQRGADERAEHEAADAEDRAETEKESDAELGGEG
jgi:hypothetical protein